MLKWFKVLKDFWKQCDQVSKELHQNGYQVHYHHGGVFVHHIEPPKKTTHINTTDDRLNKVQRKDTRTKR
jgi:hypothetical protein